MRSIPSLLLSIALTAFAASAVAGTAPFGTAWPGSTPELFAPGVVNTDGVEINLVFDRDTTELFFARTTNRIFYIYTSRRYGESWATATDAETYWMDAAIIKDLRGD